MRNGNKLEPLPRPENLKPTTEARRHGEKRQRQTFETQRKGGSGGNWADEEGQRSPRINADQGTKSFPRMDTMTESARTDFHHGGREKDRVIGKAAYLWHSCQTKLQF